ncbi:hypothetical protein TGVAND_310275 [Toxoplasma gondii VAND]|uniref:Uncharacterized protein n=1 Tax=Toxoplasma gondii VAND TaxID=933077 RepID=A0A086PPY0_TOXGO|nr:hypothetical protein TGVAND_310275 [Toxoplasma gondii VAND]
MSIKCAECVPPDKLPNPTCGPFSFQDKDTFKCLERTARRLIYDIGAAQNMFFTYVRPTAQRTRMYKRSCKAARLLANCRACRAFLTKSAGEILVLRMQVVINGTWEYVLKKRREAKEEEHQSLIPEENGSHLQNRLTATGDLTYEQQNGPRENPEAHREETQIPCLRNGTSGQIITSMASASGGEKKLDNWKRCRLERELLRNLLKLHTLDPAPPPCCRNRQQSDGKTKIDLSTSRKGENDLLLLYLGDQAIAGYLEAVRDRATKELDLVTNEVAFSCMNGKGGEELFEWNSAESRSRETAFLQRGDDSKKAEEGNGGDRRGEDEGQEKEGMSGTEGGGRVRQPRSLVDPWYERVLVEILDHLNLADFICTLWSESCVALRERLTDRKRKSQSKDIVECLDQNCPWFSGEFARSRRLHRERVGVLQSLRQAL